MVLSTFLLACAVDTPIDLPKPNITPSKDSITKTSEKRVNIEYINSYFVKSKDFYKQNTSATLTEELEFLDYKIAFFKSDSSILNLDVDSLFSMLFVKAFQPSDTAYFIKSCAPKLIKWEDLTIANYGKVIKYDFKYQRSPACGSNSPALIINNEKNEIILIEAFSTNIKNKGDEIEITFNTRGNIGKYYLNYKKGKFVCENLMK